MCIDFNCSYTLCIGIFIKMINIILSLISVAMQLFDLVLRLFLGKSLRIMTYDRARDLFALRLRCSTGDLRMFNMPLMKIKEDKEFDCIWRSIFENINITNIRLTLYNKKKIDWESLNKKIRKSATNDVYNKPIQPKYLKWKIPLAFTIFGREEKPEIMVFFIPDIMSTESSPYDYVLYVARDKSVAAQFYRIWGEFTKDEYITLQ